VGLFGFVRDLNSLPAISKISTMNKNLIFKLTNIGVHNKQISQHLFKYRTIDSVKQLLENNSLWFSSPIDFNDPFDCPIVPNTNNTEDEIREFIRVNVPKRMSSDEISNLAAKVFSEPGRWKKTIEQTYSTVIKSAGICCFTKNDTNLLMWSHYSDSHKGVCIKFDILKDPEFFFCPLPVVYSKEYPTFNHLNNRDNRVKDVVLSKSIDWQYEDEIRVLKMNLKGLLAFKKEALIEIIFGCNSSEENIQEVIELAEKENYRIKFKKANKKEREFGLIIVDL